MKNVGNRALVVEKKKLYISPVSEMADLRAMGAMMDSPLFGPASMPDDSFKTLAPRKRWTEVF